ncbi:peptidase [Arthrobacter sp. Soil763]|nr:peptidase [Arthrobacter sp. Soil763]
MDVPGHGRFFLTDAALEMVGVFGGTLHCYLGPGGCRKQGLYFSRTLPRKPLRCELVQRSTGDADPASELQLSVSHELAPLLDGAILDFGQYNKMQRFVWASLPAVKGPQCMCFRAAGAPAGKRSPCLDDAGTGLTDL